MTTIEAFADFACALDAPTAARAAARRCLLDWMGAAIAGSGEMPATGLRRALPLKGAARLIPEGTADPRTAALINGTASHIVEVDDIYRSGLYHPGVVVIPAALALADAEGASGARLINAIIAGYEVSNRIARAVNPAHYQHWHTTATVGHFGAAIAGAVALGLNPDKAAHAMANAATMAAGLRHAFSSDAMSKPLHAGRAAEAGVLTALMAREGITGVVDILEGERGFGIAMSQQVDWAGAVATLGQEWTIVETTPKAHACCGHNFATLDAIAHLIGEHQIAPEDIIEIEVRTYKAAVEICGQPTPASAAEGRFSLPYCAAVMVRKGAVAPLDFAPDALADPATLSMASKVRLQVDAAAEARFPDARSSTVRIALSDGSHVEHFRPTRKGDPDDPLSDAEIARKYHALATPVLGGARSGAIERAIAGIEQMTDIRDLPLGGAPAAA